MSQHAGPIIGTKKRKKCSLFDEPIEETLGLEIIQKNEIKLAHLQKCDEWNSDVRSLVPYSNSKNQYNTNSVIYRAFYYFLEKHCKQSLYGRAFDDQEVLHQMENYCKRLNIDFNPMRQFCQSTDAGYLQNVMNQIFKDSTKPNIHIPMGKTRLENDFTIWKKLGQGGFGSVYKVQHRLDKNFYAIKKMDIDLNSAESKKMLNEVEIGTKFSHRNIVRYITSWIDTEFLKKGPNIVEMDSSEASEVFSQKQKKSNNGMFDFDQKDLMPNFSMPPVNALEWGGTSDSDWSSSDSNLSETSDEKPLVSNDPQHNINFLLGKVTSLSPNNSFLKSQTQLVPFDEKIDLSPSVSFQPNRRENNPSTSSVEEIHTFCIQMDHCIYSMRFYLNVRNATMLSCNVDGENVPMDEYASRYPDEFKTGEFVTLSISNYVSQTFSISKNLLSGISYLHEKQVIHRDIKPENILWHSGMKQWQICDFGLARELVQENASATNVVALNPFLSSGIGTLHYAAPEQRASSMYTFAVDVYAAGFVIFELYYPMVGLSERIRVFESIKKTSTLPIDFVNRQIKYIQKMKEKMKNISETIELMIQKDWSERPTAAALLNQKVFNAEKSFNLEDSLDLEEEIRKRDYLIQVNIDFYENALSKQSAVIDSKNLEISLLHHELEQMKLKRMRERREIKLLQTELEYLEEN